jgi:hypothetical protein
MPQTKKTGDPEFTCEACGWKSSYDDDFVTLYRYKWNIEGIRG